MGATRHLQKLGGNFHIVLAVLQYLHTALSWIKVRPGVAVKAVALITCVASL
jgi:hypothetical protein